MLIIRPSTKRDIDQLLQMSVDVGVGMTTMPADRATWERRVANSCRSFALEKVEQGTEETYFMVMEDTEKNQLVGTTAVYSGVGGEQPFYSYKVSKLIKFSEQLGINVQSEVLFLVNDYTGAVELGSLYLKPEMRCGGNGRFLSRCRYLLLADFPERFSDTVIAEMRGWLDENKNSPFWVHLGEKFFGLAFDNVDYHSAIKGSQIISDLMPKYPIYVDLLPREAREVIGKPHADSLPALKLLEKEGFKYRGYVDVFDGGPTVSCEPADIATVQASVQTVLTGESEIEGGDLFIISNGRLDNYRIIRSQMHFNNDGSVLLPQASIENLQLSSGDMLRYVR